VLGLIKLSRFGGNNEGGMREITEYEIYNKQLQHFVNRFSTNNNHLDGF